MVQTPDVEVDGLENAWPFFAPLFEKDARRTLTDIRPYDTVSCLLRA